MAADGVSFTEITRQLNDEENNRGLISNISSNMPLNELFARYVKMQTKRKKIKKTYAWWDG